VTTYLRDSDELGDMSTSRRLSHAASPVYSRTAVREVDRLIQAARPDVLHLHNPYPLISMSVVPAAKRRGIACVQTVHNHRHTCMKGTYQREGRDCRDCLAAGNPGPGIVHACYRSSRPQSAVMAAALVRARRPYRLIDRFIALTPEIADSLRQSGFDAEKISLKPNSVPDPGPPCGSGTGFAFVGRLSEEKGVLALLQAWTRFPPGQLGVLRIAGDGPARAEVDAVAGARPDVEVVGRLEPAEVGHLLAASAVIVVPSLWPEAFPLVLVEGMAAGRALLVTSQGGLPRVVNGDIGRVVDPNVDGLAEGLASLAADPALTVKLGREARKRYVERYHPRAVTEELVRIYERTLATTT
jgi:glycosyltransferase involved in cell wall biosynthesis